MKIIVIGAGPVGLLSACLLKLQHHAVTVYDKRSKSGRSHNLKINDDVISAIINKVNLHGGNRELTRILKTWGKSSGNTVNILDIETSLSEIATDMGVVIHRGITISNFDKLRCDVIIGADGSKSAVRSHYFENRITDVHTVGYLAQLKYQTPGATRPRQQISAMSYSFINGLSGSDIVVDFESLAPSNDTLRKTGTLHIPITKDLYDVLTADGRGTYTTPWTRAEISKLQHQQAQKLSRIINRYNFSLQWRGGWLEDAKITTLPLTIYRSEKVAATVDGKLIRLVGDASSGMVYERGLNKGWAEVLQCIDSLYNTSGDDYETYCADLFNREYQYITTKSTKISKFNSSTSAIGMLLLAGMGVDRNSKISK